jgi:hypothetical protein
MLRSDLEALEKQGRIDLKALGLVPQEEGPDQNMGEMFVTALKNVSARFRREAPAVTLNEADDQAA